MRVRESIQPIIDELERSQESVQLILENIDLLRDFTTRTFCIDGDCTVRYYGRDGGLALGIIRTNRVRKEGKVPQDVVTINTMDINNSYKQAIEFEELLYQAQALIKTKNFDNDAYYIDNTVVPLSATKNGENVDVNEAINEYIDEFLPHVETYYESEEYYRGVDQVISQYPLLNADYVATYYDTKFIR